MDIILFGLASLIIFSSIKVWLDRKPTDGDGKMIISTKEQFLSLAIIALVLIATLFVKRSSSEVIDITALITLVIVGATVFWMHSHNSNKK